MYDLISFLFQIAFLDSMGSGTLEFLKNLLAVKDFDPTSPSPSPSSPQKIHFDLCNSLKDLDATYFNDNVMRTPGVANLRRPDLFVVGEHM